MKKETIENAYSIANETYGQYGVDTEQAILRLSKTPISIHCWQGDDVTGFEHAGSLDGGLVATGNYPGKARNADELRNDLAKAMSLVPGSHRVNLHAIYAETNGRKVDRNAITFDHFSRWADWAAGMNIGLDFNPSFFAHPKAASGLTLTHPDKGIRRFWVEHGIACRNIGEAFGKRLGKPCVTNVWIPDGSKDNPADRRTPRLLLESSLNDIFAHKVDPAFNLDAVESKLFGIGTECYVAGSHEFYLAYAVRHNKLLCLDMGHFHPTESIADKISSLLVFMDELLIHVSRGVRWDSDHVVIANDDLRAVCEEIARSGALDRVHLALDYFDASINRVAAWVIGIRNLQRTLLTALLEPQDAMREAERKGDNTARLAWMEEAKALPANAVWDYFCHRNNIPVGPAWLTEVKQYEADVLSKRQ